MAVHLTEETAQTITWAKTFEAPVVITNDGVNPALQINADGNASIRLNNPAGNEIYSEFALANDGVDAFGMYGWELSGDPIFGLYDYQKTSDFLYYKKATPATGTLNLWGETFRASHVDIYDENTSWIYSDSAAIIFNAAQADIDFWIGSTSQEKAFNVIVSSTPANERIEVNLPFWLTTWVNVDEIKTTVGATGVDTALVTEQGIREAITASKVLPVSTTAVSETIAPSNGEVVKQTANTITTTLPASPATGDNFKLANRGGGTNTIAGNGNNIEGFTTYSILDWKTADLVFDGTERLLLNNV